MPAPGPTQVWCPSRGYPGCLPRHNPGKALSRVLPGWLCGGLHAVLRAVLPFLRGVLCWLAGPDPPPAGYNYT